MVNLLATKLLLLTAFVVFQECGNETTYKNIEINEYEITNSDFLNIVKTQHERLTNCNDIKIFNKYPKLLYVNDKSSTDSTEVLFSFSQNIPIEHVFVNGKLEKEQININAEIAIQYNDFIIIITSDNNGAFTSTSISQTGKKINIMIPDEKDSNGLLILTAFDYYYSVYSKDDATINLSESNFCY